MRRKPEHYPKWMREILFNPFTYCSNTDQERNIKTLYQIYSSDKSDAYKSLIFDFVMEIERNEIKQQEIHEGQKKVIVKMEEKINTLTKKIETDEKIIKGLQKFINKYKLGVL